MLTGNVHVIIEKLLSWDDYGQPAVSETFSSRCAIVKLDLSAEKTVARMSQSASLGNASEYLSAATLLFPINTRVNVGDKLTLKGAALRVDRKALRSDVMGRDDHYQLECSIWQS